MKNSKCPYSFPLRKRADIIARLGEHESYCPMNSWNGGFCLAWNIKVHNFDSMGGGDYLRKPENDSEWESYVENSDSIFWDACGDATRYYTDSEWSNYPGIEQGEWKFSINGRSGGYMLLEDSPGWLPLPRGWTCHKATWESRAHFVEWLGELDYSTLLRFYKAMQVLDSDLSRENCRKSLESAFGFLREQWEEERAEEQEAADSAMAEKIAEERPDLAPQWESAP